MSELRFVAVALWMSLLASGCFKAPPPPENPKAAQPAVTNGPLPARPSGSETVWTVDPAMDRQLAPPIEACGFLVRPPQGYAADPPATPPQGLQIAGWSGERRTDGVGPRLQFMVVSTPPGETVPSLEIAAAKMLAAVQRRRTNWTETPIEYGTINGLKFSKQSWSGREPNTGIDMRGTMFVAVDGDRILQLHAQDTQEFFDTTGGVLEAAALSLRSK